MYIKRGNTNVSTSLRKWIQHYQVVKFLQIGLYDIFTDPLFDRSQWQPQTSSRLVSRRFRSQICFESDSSSRQA